MSIVKVQRALTVIKVDMAGIINYGDYKKHVVNLGMDMYVL